MAPPPIAHPWIDSSEAPLYVWRFPDDFDFDEMVACNRAREEWAKGVAEPVGWVTDLTALKSVTARHRKEFAAHLDRFRAFDTKWTVASGIVADAAWMRGVVTAVFWIPPPVFAYRVFARTPAAIVWTRAELTKVRAARGFR